MKEVRAFYSVDYEDGTDSFNAIILSYGNKEKRFDTGDPLIDWFQFYKYVYSGAALQDKIIGIGGSSTIDHWFMDSDTYVERYLKKSEDGTFDFMTTKEIWEIPLYKFDECLKCVAHKDMKSFQEVKDYYYNFVKKLPMSKRLKRAGIKTLTIKDETGNNIKYLKWGDKQIPRPARHKYEEIIEEHFDLKI